MNTFCTIITADHLGYALAICDNIKSIDKSVDFNVLVVDEIPTSIPKSPLKVHGIEQVVESSAIGKKIHEKYSSKKQLDNLRWSLKPVLINYLFEQGYEKVIFTDPDTFYFSDFNFLFEELENSNILLTPHWRGLDPTVGGSNFDLQFVGGLFNAGFIGVSQKAVKVMEWWAKCCLHKCVKDFPTGQFVDQTYLNLMPVYFDGVNILKHQGCNVANWNQLVCKRGLIDGQVLINNKWEIVFIHFTKSTIKGIVQGQDELLVDYLTQYKYVLSQNGKKLKLESYISNEALYNNLYKKIRHWIGKALRKK